ncbi:MAG: hypothetical protein WBM07_10415 [Chitinivibrionales bacterium]
MKYVNSHFDPFTDKNKTRAGEEGCQKKSPNSASPKLTFRLGHSPQAGAKPTRLSVRVHQPTLAGFQPSQLRASGANVSVNKFEQLGFAATHQFRRYYAARIRISFGPGISTPYGCFLDKGLF